MTLKAVQIQVKQFLKIRNGVNKILIGTLINKFLRNLSFLNRKRTKNFQKRNGKKDKFYLTGHGG